MAMTLLFGYFSDAQEMREESHDFNWGEQRLAPEGSPSDIVTE
jgi:hypothetical protein